MLETTRNSLYYKIKWFIPRRIQIGLRRIMIQKKMNRCKNVWPILKSSAKKPEKFAGWPDNKKFALVLTHDVDTHYGHSKCIELMQIEKEMGLFSSFNFVPERYQVSSYVRNALIQNGFEVGVHGLKHDGKLFQKKTIFEKRAKKINSYIKRWNVVGFRSPAMHHNLEWISDLKIEYDASTFDTDPFEPQSDGVGTIFPMYINGSEKKGYVELPYTLPQDFTVLVLLKDYKNLIWKTKLDWIVEKGGMALLNTHPDYMAFSRKKRFDAYPVRLYIEFLEYIQKKYSGQYWHILPKKMATYWKSERLK